MKILAVDTSTHVCGVAVLNGDNSLTQAMIISRNTHTRHLLTLIDRALVDCGLVPAELDGFAVSRGPGSFTGLRIGISTVKGLAAACDKPLAGVSSLEALAFPFSACPFPICALLDAGKGQVYTCRYRTVSDQLKPLAEEKALPPEAAASDAVSGIDGSCLFIGSGAVLYREIIRSVAGEKALFAPAPLNDIRPESVAFLGRNRLAANDADHPAGFAPVYIRPPDAVVNQRSPGRKS